MRFKNPVINDRVFVISLKISFSGLIRVRTAKTIKFCVFFVTWKTVDVILQSARAYFKNNKKALFFSMQTVAIKKGNEKRSNLLNLSK